VISAIVAQSFCTLNSNFLMPRQFPLGWNFHDLCVSAPIEIQSGALLKGDSQSDSHTTGGSYSSDYSRSSAHAASDAQSDAPSDAQSHTSGSDSSDHSSHPSTRNDAQYAILIKRQSRVRRGSDHESRSSSCNDAQSALLLKDDGVGQATALTEHGQYIRSKAGTPVVSSPSHSSSANAVQTVTYSNSLLQSQRMY